MKSVGIKETSNDGQFLQRVFSGGPNRYLRRLRRLGFEGMGSVLDAGAGFGQWTIVLAHLNQKVSAFDASLERVGFLDLLLNELGITNVSTTTNSLPDVPQNDRKFGGVFCFGAIFLSPWKTSVRNLASALQPGGLIYLNANDLGWYLYLYETKWNEAEDYSPGDYLVASLEKTSTYKEQGTVSPAKGHVIITRAELKAELEGLGFCSIRQGPDGAAASSFLNRRFPVTRFFPGTYKGFDSVHEVLARR